MKPHRCGTVAPSHLLLKFGKLTTKFELLCKETKTLLFQNFGGETYGAASERANVAGRAASASGADAGGGCGGEQVRAVRGQCRETKAQKP